MRKLMLLAVIAGLFLASAPVEARAISRRSTLFTAPVAMGPYAIGAVGACSSTGSQLEGVTHDDKVVRAPRGANLMIVYLRPQLDWDLYVCRGGKEIRHSAKGIGALESVVIRVRPGYSYRLRAINWAGEPEVPGSYAFYRL